MFHDRTNCKKKKKKKILIASTTIRIVHKRLALWVKFSADKILNIEIVVSFFPGNFDISCKLSRRRRFA